MIISQNGDLESATISFDTVVTKFTELYNDIFAQVFPSDAELASDLHSHVLMAEPVPSVNIGYSIEGLRSALQVAFNEAAFFPVNPRATRYITEDDTWKFKNADLHDFIEKKDQVVFVEVETGLDYNGHFSFRQLTKALRELPTDETGLIFISDGKFVLIEKDMPKMLLINADNRRKILSKSKVFVTDCELSQAAESLYYGTPMLGIPQTKEQMTNCKRLEQMGVARIVEGELPENLSELVWAVANGIESDNAKKIGE